MAKNKVEVTKEVDDDEQGIVSLKVKLPNDDDTVLCPVCGHKNPKNAGLCEMCSNYLFN